MSRIVRVFHISDLHGRGEDGPQAERARIEAPLRWRVIRAEWDKNLKALQEDGRAVDLVVFTGDLGDWGHATDYPMGVEFLKRTCHALKVPLERLFVVPGNHDVDRNVEEAAWKALRKRFGGTARAGSEWMAGGKPPVGFRDRWRDAILERQAAFWKAVTVDLDRAALGPWQHPHRRLGYQVEIKLDGLTASLWIVGLDTAWLAGGDADTGSLRLTENQVELLASHRGANLPGFRLALMHHRFADLADGERVRRLLADRVDLVLHGHQHESAVDPWASPDHSLLVVAAGCLYEGDEGHRYPNACQMIDIQLADDGRPERAVIQFRGWAERDGLFWGDDGLLYRNAKHGRLSLRRLLHGWTVDDGRAALSDSDSVQLHKLPLHAPLPMQAAQCAVMQEASPVTQEASPVTQEASPVTQEASPVTQEAPLVTQRDPPLRRRLVVLVLFGLVVVAAVTGVGIGLWRPATTEVYSVSCLISDERITPLGLLTKDQQRHRWSSLRLIMLDATVIRVERISGVGAVRPLSPITSNDTPYSEDILTPLDDNPMDGEVTSMVPHYDRDHGLYEIAWHARDGTLILTETYTDGGRREWYRDAGGAPLRPVDGDVVGANRSLDEHGRVTGVRFINAYATARRVGIGVFGIDFRRNAHGAVIQRSYTTDAGQPITEQKGEFLRTYDRDVRDEVVRETVLGIDNAHTLGHELFHRREFERDAWRNAHSEVFFDTSGEAAPDETGAARRDYHYDEHGNLRSVAYFDVRGNPVAITDGYARVELAYDEKGNETSRSFFDGEGQPALNRAGYAHLERSYDSLGYELSRRFYDRAGKATLHKDGYAGAHYTWKNGYVLETTYLDREASPTVRSGGYARVRVTRDRLGHEVEWAALMPDGTHAYRNGYAYVKKSWTESGYQRDETYYDANDRPTLRADWAVASIKFGYNEYGDQTYKRFFDAAGQPVINTAVHCAGLEWESDKRGNRASTTCVGPDGSRILDGRGCARELFGYDAQGNRVEQRCLDEKLQPTLDNQGVSLRRWHYNLRGEQTLEEEFDEQGARVLTSDEHVSRFEHIYDPNGKRSETRHFDEKGMPTLCVHGVAGSRITYDARGNTVALVQLGLDFTPETAFPHVGSVRWVQSFDDQGRRLELRFFDAKGAAVFDGGTGAHAIKSEYDLRGNTTAKYFLGVGELPVVANNGYAYEELRYDDQGHLIEDKIFDASHQLTDGKRGYAIKRQEFDARGQVSVATFLAAALKARPSQPPRIDFKYDPQGRLTEESYYDAAGSLTTIKDGIARKRYSLDEKGRRIDTMHYGPDEKLLDRAHGVAHTRQTFDSHDNDTSVSFFDADGAALEGPGKFARMEHDYDDHERLIDERYFDARGRRTNGSIHVSRVHWNYDARGREAERLLYGTDDKLTLNTDNVARLVTEYDRRDNLTERRFYGTDGRTLALHRLGYTRRTLEYNERGNLVVESYYGLDGSTLTKQAGGYARQRRKYDERGLLRDVTFEDENGGAAAIADGIARLVLRYDAFGNEMRREVFGAHGEALATTLALVDNAHLNASNRAVVVLAVDAEAAAAGVQPGDVVLMRAEQIAGVDLIRAGKLRLEPGATRLQLLRWRLGSASERTVEVAATAQIGVALSVSFVP